MSKMRYNKVQRYLFINRKQAKKTVHSNWSDSQQTRLKWQNNSHRKI